MKKIVYILSFLMLVAYGHTGMAQVRVNNNVIFTSADSAKNAAYNLGDPTQENSAVHAKNGATNNLIFDNAISGTDTITINLPLNPDTLVPGMLVGFKANAAITRAVVLNYNGDYYNLLADQAGTLQRTQIAAGQSVYCLYDGTDFQLVNTPLSFCPPGFVQVTERYCIEPDERPVEFFWDAINDCAALNAKICTWGEWYYACTQTGLGLTNMTTNYEWIDDAGDHTQFAITVGNSGSCTSNTSIAVSSFAAANKKNFRCCYRR